MGQHAFGVCASDALITSIIGIKALVTGLDKNIQCLNYCQCISLIKRDVAKFSEFIDVIENAEFKVLAGLPESGTGMGRKEFRLTFGLLSSVQDQINRVPLEIINFQCLTSVLY